MYVILEGVQLNLVTVRMKYLLNMNPSDNVIYTNTTTETPVSTIYNEMKIFAGPLGFILTRFHCRW